jgi:hypothetical protein
MALKKAGGLKYIFNLKYLFLLGWLFGFLWQQDGLDVGENTTLSNGHTRQEFVQLFVVSDGQLQVSWDDSGLLVISGSVSGQLENLSAQVFENGSQVDWGTRTNTLCVVTFSQESVHTTDWKL